MPAGRIRTQGLTEGAILAALVAVLAVATHYIPLIGIATAYLCPLPLAVLVIRHGFRVAALAAVVSILAAITIAGPLAGLSILILYAPIGIVLGIGARQHWTAERVVGTATLVSVVSLSLSFLGLTGGEALSMAEMSKTMERSVDMSAGLYARMGLPQAQIDAISQQMRDFARLLPYLLPAMLVLGAAVAAWLNYEVGRRVLDRFGYRLPTLPPMRTWRLPAPAVWLVPLSYLVMAAGALASTHHLPVSQVLREPVDALPPLLQSIGWSLTIGVQMLFSLQGVVAGWVILGNYGFGRFAQIIAVVMVMAVPLLGLIVFTLGILDSMMKVRERWGFPRPAPPGAGA